ncbi:MAG: peptidoglycan DD-metalloendopeptidase family protein [Ardenticatenaceae bacterium]|nr:peptidoglycan DD-metalloendopeptidase family protein [Ardenticatenaceae bacterium]MCB8974600.1 peptidoglycan DD-metalloendopeptidase family protein [Ardenticatenaceae bacterium]
MNEQRFWHRLSGHFILAGGALILLALGQFQWGGVTETELAVATAVPTQPSLVEETGVETAVTPTPLPLIPIPVLNDSSLVPLPNPLTYQTKPPAHTFQMHEVARGETPNIIADKYGISADTLLGGNSWLSQESNQLQVGAQLIILPVDGVLHKVRAGETLESIAELYRVTPQAIIDYAPNNLEFPFYRLVPESELVVPGASIGQFFFTAPKSVATNAAGQPQWKVFGTGTYIWPSNGRCITQFYNGFHPAVDVSASEGSPVYASDTGTVTYASFAAGTYYDYGNLIVINHGNGFETFYAHLSSIGVFPGQTVTQGDLIGFTGNTGRSSGPHIHFEIRDNDFRTNPLDRLGGGYQNCS